MFSYLFLSHITIIVIDNNLIENTFSREEDSRLLWKTSYLLNCSNIRFFWIILSLKSRFKHLRDIPLQPFNRVNPLLLIGADNPHLINSVKLVRLGPPGGTAAIRTKLGWMLQGTARLTEL